MTSTSSSSAASDAKRPDGPHDIQLYSLATPNGQKIAWYLDAAGIPYDAHKIDISKGDQFSSWFVKEVNPNSKIPAIVDKKGPKGQPFSVIESGAILIYLSKKYGKFVPADPEKESEAIQWLMWQMGGFGPMIGQMGHFFRYAPEDVPYAKKRYETEAKRLFAVLEKQLDGKTFVVGDELTLPDFAIFPWANAVKNGPKWKDMGDLPNVTRYVESLAARPAFQRAAQVTPFG